MGQSYDIDVFKETVIHGNDALLKCAVPSFMSDLVEVVAWVDSEGTETFRRGQSQGDFSAPLSI